ncbi:MAG: molecular chaperone HtpG [Pirellulales bacterium]
MTATAQAETHAFQAETARLLDMMIHSLYTNKEIFLRELISNASDALDKVRFEALTNQDLLGDDTELQIRLETDPEARTLTVSDNGIGMTREEVIQNIGTIAKSGTRELLEKLKDSGASDQPADLIGQFGVGFYSAFMVADQVTLITRHAEEDSATQWQSSGDGQYTLQELDSAADQPGRGTRVTLHLKEADAEEGQPDYSQPALLAQIVKSHSDFVAYPIVQEQTREEIERDDQGQPVEDGETKSITEDVTLNSMQPIWIRPQADVTEEEYAEFYHHISHDWQPPAKTISLKAEGRIEFSTLLFIPSQAPPNLHYANQDFGLHLYVKRVLIMENYDELLPRYLRFMKGIVDSSDLPLNISRQRLQEDRHIKQIRQWISRRVLDTLGTMQEEKPEVYATFWGQFGGVLKEGLADHTAKSALLPLLMFSSSADPDKLTSLVDYVGRMAEGQEEIYFITGDSRALVENAPQLEKFKAKQYEVLYLTDPVDEFMAQYLDKFDDKPIKSAVKGTVELGDEEERKQAEETLKKQSEQHAKLLESLQKSLDDHVKEVRLTSRLTDSPSCLVGSEFDLSPQLERMLRDSGAEMPTQKRILELNPNHPLLEKLQQLQDSDGLADHAFMLYSNAVLAEGGDLPDPARFNRLLAELMLK